MRTISRRTLTLLVALAMTLSVSVGMTLAYFSDYAAAEGSAVLHLTGKTVVVEPTKDEGKKEIKIENVSDQPVDVVARVQVIGPVEIAFSGSDWEKSGDWWYYKKVIPQGEASGVLTAEWTIPEDSPIENYDVVVLHESAVATYNDNGFVKKPAGWDGFPSDVK